MNSKKIFGDSNKPSTHASKQTKIAKFNVGDVVVHKHQGYHAVIVDIDPIFQASGHYNPRAAQYEFAQRNPWYRLLVDGYNQETYVEEPFLELDIEQIPINNSAVTRYLIYRAGRYYHNKRLH